jgi:hypothetical protein
MYLPLIVCSLHFTASSLAKHSQEPRDTDGEPYTLSLSRKSPDSDPSADPGHMLNSEWLPDPSNHVSILLDTISPFNDNGRLPIVDNFVPTPSKINCPAILLNCNRCPLDLRCSPPNCQPTPQPVGVGERNAITGQQDYESPAAVPEEPSSCLVQKCNEVGAPPCGSGAVCKKDYYMYPPGRQGRCLGLKGWKGLRGWTWPQVLNVFFDPNVACETPCDAFFCGEVKRGRGCEGLQSLRPGQVDDMMSIINAALADTTSVLSTLQTFAVETPSLTLPKSSQSAPQSQSQSVSTRRGVPVRSYVSQMSIMLPQSTGRRVVPTRSAAHDDYLLPTLPGNMGAIHKPGPPEARAEADADYVAGPTDLESVGESV